jgi:hypothetical protein
MVLAVGGGLAGVAVGWGFATGDPLPAAVVVPLVLVALFIERARTSDHRTVPASSAAAASGWEDLHRELARARRHERPLSIVRLSGGATDGAAGATAIVPFLRRIDRVWSEHGDVNLLLPEADRAAAEHLVGRLRTRRPGLAGSTVSIVSFPVDGLTSGALLAALYGTPLPTVAVPVGIGRPAELPADVIELRPHLVPDVPLTDRRESSS